MRKARILLVIGVWITILPYLGFPYSWKDMLTIFSGLLLVFVSYLFYREYKEKEKHDKIPFDNFRENSDFKENTTEEERSQ